MSPKELEFENIKNILDKGTFEGFIGIRESDCLEAKKKSSYNLADPESRLEMSKDIAALANNKAGFIICGLKTEHDENVLADVVVSLDLTRKDEIFTKEKLIGVLNEYTYPRINVDVKWFPFKKDPVIGLTAIIVNEQEKKNKHFLVKITHMDGRKLKGLYFGIPTRKISGSDWTPVSQLHRLSKLTPEKIEDIQESLSAQIQEIKELIIETGGTKGIQDNLDSKLRDLLDE
jgi:hypothetical protein